MNRHHSHHNSAVQILEQYKGEEPLSSFLKKYFSSHKKFGSKDRKQVAHLCYCYFRLGKSLPDLSKEERILAGLFLCSTEPNEIISVLKPEWNEKIAFPLKEKLSFLNYQLSSGFPWKDEMSNGIDHESFCESFFIQPDFFIRLRPGFEGKVKAKLENRGIGFTEINKNCLSLPNGSKIESVIEIDKEAVVQDYNSQQSGKYFQTAIAHCSLPIDVWDCCAGSGGKSIMAYDIDPNIDLIVSDVRESILINLKKRFEKSEIKKYRSFVIDLTKDINVQHPIINNQQSIIIADVPCSGSGTWSRTPEQLFYFDEKKIAEYSSLQKKIVSNVISHLQPGGHFLYITCSVFKKENEEVVEYIKQEFNLDVVKMPARMTRSDGELLKGYDKKADTMFAALLKKPL